MFIIAINSRVLTLYLDEIHEEHNSFIKSILYEIIIVLFHNQNHSLTFSALCFLDLFLYLHPRATTAVDT